MTGQTTVPTWFRRAYLLDNLSTLGELQRRCRFTTDQAAAYVGVTRRTFDRWRKDGAPEWPRLLLAIRAGDLPWDGWRGWEMQDGALVPPGYRIGLAPGEILAMPYQYQLISELQRQIRTFRHLDDQLLVV